MQPDTISIVIPVYNSENTLERTLGSLISQAYRPLEIVCVDDGSTDGSAALLERYQKQTYEGVTIKVVNQPNAGPSAARNTGLSALSGNIVMFVDADDALEAGACEKVAKVFKDSNVEMLVFGAICDPEDMAPARLIELLSPKNATWHLDANGKASETLLFHSNAQPYACRSAYRTQFLTRENITFDTQVRIGEDAAFMLAALSLAKTTQMIPDKLYHYYMQGVSITHTLNTEKGRVEKAGWHIEAIASLLKTWQEHHIENLYFAEAIEWAVDLMLFDFAHMTLRDAVRLSNKLDGVLARAYGENWAERFRAASKHRACADAAQLIANSKISARLPITKFLLIRFYLETRGLKACIKRVLNR